MGARSRVLGRVAIALWACTACIGPHDLGVKPFRLPTSDFVFPTGLRVVFQRDATQPSVVVATVVDGGSSLDPPGKEGLAHLVEHLCFRARAAVTASSGEPQQTVEERIDALGGLFNAETSVDETEFYSIAPRDGLDELLAIEARRLLDPLAGVTEEDFRQEREVVTRELFQRNEMSGKSSSDLVAMVFPPAHAYHRPSSGTAESLAALTLDQARALALTSYRPDAVTIIVAGDIDPASAGARIARAFPRLLLAPGTSGSNIAASAPPPIRTRGASPAPPPPFDRGVRHVPGPVSLQTVVLAWSLPGGYRENQPVIEAAVAAMSGAIGGPCAVRIGRTSSLASCSIPVLPGREAERVASRAIDGLYALWNARDLEFQDDLVRRVRAGYLSAMVHDSSSLLRTVAFARWVHFTGRADRFARSPDDFRKIDVEDARRFAYRYLNRDRAVTVIVDPSSAGSDAPAMVEAAPTDTTGVDLRANEKPRTPPPGLVARVAISPDPTRIVRRTLPNGLDVLLMRYGTAPFLEAALFTRGGWADETPLGIAALVTEDWRADDDALPASSWGRYEWADGRLLSIDGPSGNPKAMLTALRDRFRAGNRALPADLFQRSVDRVRRAEARSSARAQSAAPARMFAALLPGHPLAGNSPDLDSLSRLSDREFESFLRTVRAPKNSTLVVVGDIDPASMEATVTRVFGAWRADAPGAPLRDLPPPPALLPERRIFLADRVSHQSEIVVACRIQPDPTAGRAARELLSETLRTDLFSRLRESTGSAFQISVATPGWRGGTALLVVSADADSARAPAALQTILARIEALSARQLADSRLESARWALARRTYVRAPSAHAMLLTLVGVLSEGKSIDSLGEYGRDLASASAEDFAELLAPCAGHEMASIVGPADTLRAPLAAIAAVEEVHVPPVPLEDASQSEIDEDDRFGRAPVHIRIPWHLSPANWD